jgi:hypothetical protein
VVETLPGVCRAVSDGQQHRPDDDCQDRHDNDADADPPLPIPASVLARRYHNRELWQPSVNAE